MLNSALARRLWLLAALLVVALPMRGLADTGADPAINRPYQDPEFSQWVETFERPGREVFDRRNEIVAASGVRPGMAVADVGAGTGLFTRLFAKAVGAQGKAYAVDISKQFVDNIVRTAREQGLQNVEGVVNAQDRTGLAAHSVDLIFVCDSYHHFERPDAMLASMHRALRPGGALIVIDFDRVPGRSSDWVMSHVRADKQTFIREIEGAGFRLREDKALLRENFFLRFERIERSTTPRP
jgi:predicted methyltransferase